MTEDMETLLRRLERLEKENQALREKIETQVESGAAAIGEGAQAVGEDGLLVNGNVDGDVLMPHAKKEVHYHGSNTADPKALRNAYLNRVMESAGYLSLAGIDPEAASKAETRLSLGAVYTALLTHSSEQMKRGRETYQWEENRLSALEMANRHTRLVLLGDPGSGKSTFVNFLALCLAGEALSDPIANLALLTAPLPVDDERREQKQLVPQPWDHGKLLPVRVFLRDFTARGLPEAGVPASAGHLWEFIVAELKAGSLEPYADYLHEELLKHGGLLLLDGLDEVPEAGKRRLQLKQAVEDFATTFKKCRILVTSRTYAYERQDWRLQDFQDTRLADFNLGQITRFVDRWYEHIAPSRGMGIEDAQGKAELLKRAIFSNDRLLSLAERPLLLTLMASLHTWRGGSLPERREQLYADTVDLLLNTWESPKMVRDTRGEVVVTQPSLSEWLKVDRTRVRGLLNELAYQAHSAQPELAGTADIAEGDLLGGLLRLSQNPEANANPALLVDYLSQRAGLLVPRGVGVYSFPHRTFQEYLAACYLTDAEHGYPDLVADLAVKDPGRWREVALLAGAKAARGGAFALWALVDCLCSFIPEESVEPQQDAWGARLAGQALVETVDLDQVGEHNRPKVERVRRWLVHILQHGSLPAVERAAAGRHLARLGDPRFDPDKWFLSKEDLLGFVEIPAGEFLMGSDPTKDKQAADDEKPQHPLNLPGYYMARYPVTVVQFRVFVEASGYQPSDTDSLEGLANHPVVDVTWYDSLAYCRWLGEKLKGEAQQRVQAGSQEALWQGLASGKLHMTLPSEAEWEKGARGRQGSIYPWGDRPNPENANYDETGIGTTSAVGCFPGGASPYGSLDMSGNVWEWTRSLWGEYPYPDKKRERASRENLEADENTQRVLRGGAFYNYAWRVRCAFRFRYGPYIRNLNIGFRVVVSPTDSEL